MLLIFISSSHCCPCRRTPTCPPAPSHSPFLPASVQCFFYVVYQKHLVVSVCRSGRSSSPPCNAVYRIWRPEEAPLLRATLGMFLYNMFIHIRCSSHRLQYYCICASFLIFLFIIALYFIATHLRYRFC